MVKLWNNFFEVNLSRIDIVALTEGSKVEFSFSLVLGAGAYYFTVSYLVRERVILPC
jgi:hypothetical protein